MKSNRLKYGTPRAKQLEEIENNKLGNTMSRYSKRHNKGCYKAAIKRYFIKEIPYTLSGIY